MVIKIFRFLINIVDTNLSRFLAPEEENLFGVVDVSTKSMGRRCLLVKLVEGNTYGSLDGSHIVADHLN